jgi:diguanylate cyclase (GGDEF)-like protein
MGEKPAATTLAEREAAILAREAAVGLREKALSEREAAGGRRIERRVRARTEAQLREANERLVVATVNSEAMTEAAEQATARMSHIAEHDFLTGLPNRSVLTARLAQSIALAQRHGKKVALMFLDIDHFKHINDSLGHAAGDQLLQAAAKRLQACVRGSDTVSRHGGDEFVVLLAEVEQAQDAALTAEKLIEAMAAPYLIGGHRLHVTLSIGVCLYPEDGSDVETLVMHADTAMYHAKRSGRNNYKRFTLDMNARAVARQSVEEALRLALERREFVLHYQPKVNLATGTVTGAEALLRWQQSGRRMVQPMEFVRIAEDCGLIVPIGNWVLGEACRQASAWLQAGLEIGQVAVNVSAAEFGGKDFVPGVRAAIAETGLDPQRLELELTESGLMQDTARTMQVLRALKELGVRLAIDDFGTGYSCLSYLRRFPIDTLKIDQSFVHDIEGETGEGIVSAIVAMGVSLNQRVVAEGIESPRQRAFLESRRCAEGQGFLFSRPVTADGFATLLTAGALPPV